MVLADAVDELVLLVLDAPLLDAVLSVVVVVVLELLAVLLSLLAPPLPQPIRPSGDRLTAPADSQRNVWRRVSVGLAGALLMGDGLFSVCSRRCRSPARPWR